MGGPSAQSAWRPGPGGWTSGAVEHVATIPFEAGTGIDAVLHGRYLYATTWRSFSIYDVEDPVRPVLLSQLPTPGHLINENPQTNGKILLLSNDVFNRSLDIYDVTDKALPKKIASYADPALNHMWTCVLDCAYAYGAKGSILDLANPSAPKLVGDWTTLKRPRAYHAISEVAPGIVLTGSDPVLTIDARDRPQAPSLLAELKPKTTKPPRPYLIIGPAPTSLPARVAWPLGTTSRHVLITMETPFSGSCNDESGTFLVYDAQGWDRPGFDGFELVDEYGVEGNGLPSDGSAPANAFGCGAYGLDVNTAFHRNRLTATTWFEHGTRILRVRPDGKLVDVGGFLGAGGNAVRPLWRNEEILYVVDAHRGIDILRIREVDRRYRRFPFVIPAGDLDGDGRADTVTAEAIPQREVPEGGVASFEHRISARRGEDGKVLWERADAANEILPASLGPRAAPGVLLVDGVGSITGGGGAASEGPAFGERVEVRDLVLTAVGGDGAPLWERRFDQGAFAGAAYVDQQAGRRQAVVAERFPTFAGLLQATASPATDAVVSTLTRREAADRIESRLEVTVLDGAGGTEALRFTVDVAGSRPIVRPAGDLDDDGLADLVVLGEPAPGRVTARSGRTGAILWSSPGGVVPFDASVRDLGDVTDDGRDDLAVSGTGDVFDTLPPRVAVLDGSDGRVLLSADADTVRVLGALDDEGTVGLLTQRVREGDVEYAAYRGTGERLAVRRFPVERGEDVAVSLSDAGDLDGDGVADAGHRVEGAGAEAVFVSGRTLEPIEGGAAGIPLRASLDGDGDDLVSVERTSPETFVVRARAGSGAVLWAFELGAEPLYPAAGPVAVAARDVDGDAVAEVVVSVASGRTVSSAGGGASTESITQAWILSGRDGRILWNA